MAATKPKKRVKVLIADDQTLFREGIKDLLENERSVEVIGEAADGSEVVRLAKKLRPDVILMDIKLPHLDGVSATRLILMTSGDRPGDLARLRELRIDAHLLKPVPQEELLQTIYRVMSRPPGNGPTTVRPATALAIVWPSGSGLGSGSSWKGR